MDFNQTAVFDHQVLLFVAQTQRAKSSYSQLFAAAVLILREVIAVEEDIPISPQSLNNQ